ncbi:Rv3654c family TadE-like protein [Rhodococcus sp. NPDC049939]|uniref:Rv3654c family TadE-like protein n=1 Tax=Rhodococcus sp. NPDC049939 TaxID=3155511 RepID=UPI0033DFA8A4
MSSAITDDRGAATVLACFALTALVAITAMLMHVGSVVSVRHRAQSAADLAALAAAVGLDRGTGAACDDAHEVAERMRTAMVSCEVDGWDVEVIVSLSVPLSSLGLRDAKAVARAGPAER